MLRLKRLIHTLDSCMLIKHLLRREVLLCRRCGRQRGRVEDGTVVCLLLLPMLLVSSLQVDVVHLISNIEQAGIYWVERVTVLCYHARRQLTQGNESLSIAGFRWFWGWLLAEGLIARWGKRHEMIISNCRKTTPNTKQRVTEWDEV